jgi:hypothetical protein
MAICIKGLAHSAKGFDQCASPDDTAATSGCQRKTAASCRQLSSMLDSDSRKALEMTNSGRRTR